MENVRSTFRADCAFWASKFLPSDFAVAMGFNSPTEREPVKPAIGLLNAVRVGPPRNETANYACLPLRSGFDIVVAANSAILCDC